MAVFTRTGEVSAFDAKYTGEEPTWDNSDTLTDAEIKKKFSAALNFYAYYVSAKDLIPDLILYMTNNNYKKEDIKLVKKYGEKLGVTTVGKIARMVNRGMPYSESWLNNTIKSSICKAYEIKAFDFEVKGPAKKPKGPVISPMKRLENKVDAEVISHIDYALDDWTEDSKSIGGVHVISLLAGANIPAKGCQFVHKFLDRYIGEATEAYEKTCEQMVEGYSFLTRSELRKWVKTLSKMKDDVSKYEKDNTKAIVRTKKVKPAGMQVVNMKYNKDDSKVSAVKIPGSVETIIWNPKNRKLQVYKSLTRNGFSVKGTTIKDFDVDTSYQITIRNQWIKDVVGKDSKGIDTFFKKKNSKKIKVNGRVNEHCEIILCK
jgi:hypothetical protein